VPCHKTGRTALILLHLKPAGLSTAFNRHEQAGQCPLCQVRRHAHKHRNPLRCGTISQDACHGAESDRGNSIKYSHFSVALYMWALGSQVSSPGRAVMLSAAEVPASLVIMGGKSSNLNHKSCTSRASASQ
jgi:hypothetical protein